MRLLSLILLLSSLCFAKKVNLRWDEISKATHYEIELLNDRGKSQVIPLKKNRFEKELALGIYAYRIRAFDWVDRPGEWSRYEPLPVLPDAPEPLLPKDGDKKEGVQNKSIQMFKWKAVAHAKAYQLFIQQEGGKSIERQVSIPEAEVELSPGKHTWKVKALFAAKSREISSLEKKDFSTDYSEESVYKFVQKELGKPKILGPIGRIEPVPPKEMKITWEKVPYAEKYEVQLLNEENKRVQHVFTNRTEIFSQYALSRNYTVQVRALAQIENDIPKVVGNYAQESFRMEKKAAFPDPDGNVILTFDTPPSNYRISIPSNFGNENYFNSAGIAFGARVSLWALGNSGFEATARIQRINIASDDRVLPEFELNYINRVRIGDRDNAWMVLTTVGVKAKDYLEYYFVSFPNNMSKTEFGEYGLHLGIELKKYFWKDLELGAFFKILLPFGTIGAPSDLKFADPLYYPNGITGGYVRYWFANHWGLGLSLQLEQEASQYFRSSDNIPRHFTRMGFYAAVQALYSFGR